MSDISNPAPLFAKHERAGCVSGPQEATEWAWDQAPLAPPQLLVLLSVARHVHLPNLDALPTLLVLTADEVQNAILDLMASGHLCATVGGGVHVSLDCHCA